MNRQAPQTPQAALSRAMILVENLRDTLPAKVGRVALCMDEIRNAFENQDLTHFPFDHLDERVAAVSNSIAAEYDDPDQSVDRSSLLYELIVELQHRLRISIEFTSFNEIFRSFEKRLERIDSVLPTHNYAVCPLLSQLDTVAIDPAIRKRLEGAVHRFELEEYRETIQDAGAAGEALFVCYKELLASFGCYNVPDKTGPALDHVRRWLSDPQNKDSRGQSFSPRSRIEWFVLSMFEALHYMRNVAAHSNDLSGVPDWQSERAAHFVDRPEFGRLALCLGLQLALEFQALRENGGRQR